ncbi:MAG: PAS domain S-box protein, partial [Bacteroidia bacterium]|nr:PAS domain S-box protein [Bacteroidia bacterium]
MDQALRIIHLDSHKADSDLIAREFDLQNVKTEILFVKTKQDYLKALENFDPDLVLSEFELPTISYKEAFDLLKLHKPGKPFILVTGSVKEEDALALLKGGIDDFFIKDRLKKLPLGVLKVFGEINFQKEKDQFLDEIEGKERKFGALIDNSQEAIVLRDENFNITYRSPPAEKITGWDTKELRKQSFIELIHPDDRHFVGAIVSNIKSQPGKSFNVVYRTLHKNGSYIWIDMTITNMLHDEHVKAIVTNFRDITEKKISESRLIRSNNHFRALIENISDAIVLTDEKGNVKYLSPSAKNMTGFDLSDIEGSKFTENFHPEDLAMAKTIFRSIIMRPGVTVHSSFRIRHKNGDYIWVEGSATNLLQDVSVKAVVINYRDVTARKESERMLEKSEANLRSIFDNTNISYVLINHEFKIVSFNHQALIRYKFELGADIEEGQNIINYLPEFRKEDCTYIFNKVLSGKKHSYEKDFIHQEEVSWYSVNMFPVYDDKKQILGLIISSEDITSRKIAELEREEMTSDLIQHNKNLEQFAYIISHNLRSPVSNIVGLSNLLSSARDMGEKDFTKCMEGLTLSVKKLDEVIVDLNFILQNRKEVNSQKEMLNLNQLLFDIKTITSEHIEKENFNIRSDFQVESLFTIKSYIHSIFLNLITNSIKYRNTEVASEIEISSFKDHDEVVLRFKDNGLGIDLNANASKIFGLYKRFHKHVDGKGMGLYMVKTQV